MPRGSYSLTRYTRFGNSTALTLGPSETVITSARSAVKDRYSNSLSFAVRNPGIINPGEPRALYPNAHVVENVNAVQVTRAALDSVLSSQNLTVQRPVLSRPDDHNVGSYFASVREHSIVMSMVCLWACLFVCLSGRIGSISGTTCPNFGKCSAHIACSRGSISSVANWRCTVLCTSGFVDDVVFSITRPVAWHRQRKSGVS